MAPFEHAPQARRLASESVRGFFQQLSRSGDRVAALGVLLLTRLAAAEWGEGVTLEIAPSEDLEGTRATLECARAGWTVTEILRVRHATLTEAMTDFFELLSIFDVARNGASLVLRSRALTGRTRAHTPLATPSLQLLIEAGLPQTTLASRAQAND